MKDKTTIRKMFLAVEEEFYDSLTNMAEYKEISNRRNTAEELLLNCVNHEQFKLFDNVDTCRNELIAFEIEEAYIKGFTDSNKLRDESLKC